MTNHFKVRRVNALKAIKIGIAVCALLASGTVLYAGWLVYWVMRDTMLLAGAHYTTSNYVRFALAAVIAVLSTLHIARSIFEVAVRNRPPR